MSGGAGVFGRAWFFLWPPGEMPLLAREDISAIPNCVPHTHGLSGYWYCLNTKCYISHPVLGFLLKRAKLEQDLARTCDARQINYIT